MRPDDTNRANLRERAAREAEATGAKANASADCRTVFIVRRDGTRDMVAITPPAGAPRRPTDSK